MTTAKVFKNGRSQAIRLPKDFRLNGHEVYLRKTPEGFLVSPRNPWELFFEGVEELSDDFMAGRRRQPKPQKRKSYSALGLCRDGSAAQIRLKAARRRRKISSLRASTFFNVLDYQSE